MSSMSLEPGRMVYVLNTCAWLFPLPPLPFVSTSQVKEVYSVLNAVKIVLESCQKTGEVTGPNGMHLRVAFSTPTFAIRVYVPGERGLQRLQRGEDCHRVLPEDWRDHRTERHAATRALDDRHPRTDVSSDGEACAIGRAEGGGLPTKGRAKARRPDRNRQSYRFGLPRGHG